MGYNKDLFHLVLVMMKHGYLWHVNKFSKGSSCTLEVKLDSIC